jgi:hypothetical protein
VFTALLGRVRTISAAKRKLLAALICYLMLLAAVLYVLLPAKTSDEQFILGVVLLIFAILTAKTLAHRNTN